MAYDEGPAECDRDLLARPKIRDRKMLGGLAFMVAVPEARAEDADLEAWVDRSARFVFSLLPE